MKDFASSAMMRLIQAGLAKQGFVSPAPSSHKGPHVTLASKRESVERILNVHGPLALLRIGEGLPDVREAPLLATLESAQSPQAMIDRWRRMEAYVHSKHRTELKIVEENSITLRHISVTPGNPPLRSEDLLIFGVLIGLIRWTGVINVRAKPTGESAWVYDNGWGEAPSAEDCSEWQICWTETVADETNAEAESQPSTLQELVEADPMKRWLISHAARELGMSTRSLQRRLQGANKTFSQVIGDIRAATAVRFLDQTNLSLHEIGFLSGYADQAHFTRSFKAAMAISPKRYRTKG